MTLTIESVRKQFPVLKKCIYANTATSGLLYEDLLDWRQEHDLDFLLGGAAMKVDSMAILGETKNTLVRFFNAPIEGVALTPNFSVGWNFLWEGLDKKNKVLLLENDYPSVNWPIEDRGFEVYHVPINKNTEVAILETVKTKSIDVFVLSLVQWTSGFMISQDFIEQLKLEFPNLLIAADGTQFCGMYNIDFTKSGIDVLGASGYKWLLGGYGNGFFLLSEAARSRFQLKSVGSGSVNGDPSKRVQIPFKKHLEPGHLDTLGFGSLKFSLEFLEKLGMEAIAHQNRIISQRAKEIFKDLGLLTYYILEAANHSTIFNLKLSEHQFQELQKKGIACAQRGGGVRMSFHFYNTLEDLGAIKKTLKKVL